MCPLDAVAYLCDRPLRHSTSGDRMGIYATAHLRRMRGGAQAHLVEASDGNHYVVKPQNNAQHRRVLVNEWVSAVILERLDLSMPPAAIVHFTEDFISAHPALTVQTGTSQRPVMPGRHFGSRFPGDPARLAVFDYLPDAVLTTVTNLAEFKGALVFDKWVSNSDSRQAIFFRARLKKWSDPEAHGNRMGLVALMIDNGYAFNGPQWDFPESPVQGMYFRKLVYDGVRNLDDFQPWLDRVRFFPEEYIDEAYRRVPPEWIDGEEDDFEKLLESLLKRRKRVPDLIESCRSATSAPFPNWE